jgi:hypothetical protein
MALYKGMENETQIKLAQTEQIFHHRLGNTSNFKGHTSINYRVNCHGSLSSKQRPTTNADIAKLESIRLVSVDRLSQCIIDTCHLHTLARPMNEIYNQP